MVVRNRKREGERVAFIFFPREKKKITHINTREDERQLVVFFYAVSVRNSKSDGEQKHEGLQQWQSQKFFLRVATG